ncbi:MAG TPA: DUF1330 domain-containing protein [Vitreimonas sp.]|uniref:DUF1330 domain-containing protein n=1 Tax=Vitreimonas sp. TaxID=3069702 RepID=UPI002D51525D|nr:DUF1330 domain-containing protein [Vitreimonas sp.]HYD89692.1 DUF1330 domain-containing protein [Vitreimonas sp.]
MTVYALAQLRIHDAERYGRYMSRFMPVLEKYNGKLLAADETPRVLEGQWWDRNKIVLMEFADKDAFRAWATSPEYTEIAEDRKAGADAVVLLIKGFTGA